MKPFLPEDDAVKARKRLMEEMKLDPVSDAREYTSLDINWVEDVKTYWDAKIMALDLMDKFPDDDKRNIFIAHDKDTIQGKPQLIHQTLKNITLMKQILKVKKDNEGNDSQYQRQWKFLGDNYDKRYDGNLLAEWGLDFWMYRVYGKDNKEYYAISKEELPFNGCELKGMKIEVKDFAEASRSIKMKGFSNVFLVKSHIPDVKILEKEELVGLTKEKNLTEEKWFQFLGSHELGTMNRFPKNVELLRSAQLISWEVDGYPLHLGIVGPAGTRKSMGHVETIAWKFSGHPEIIEGGNSRIKGLSPSFKEKPANIGYLARCERMGWIDELGKMVEFEMNKHHDSSVRTNVLGELNFLLDHKRRLVGSGNDNDCLVQTVAKFSFVTNPVSGKRNIYEHVGLIDPTTMSRMLWWVQGKEEQAFVLGVEGVLEIPPTLTQAYKTKEKETREKTSASKGESEVSYASVSVGGIGNKGFTSEIEPLFPVELLNRDEFLTIFDTCNSFLVDGIDKTRVLSIHKIITDMAKEPMKGVWKPRGEHHIKLLIDGLCKHRCLFIDYDPTFEVKEEDYELAQAILIQMVTNWDTDLSIKHEPDYSSGKL